MARAELPEPQWCDLGLGFQVKTERRRDAVRPVEESSLMAAYRLEVAFSSYLY
jgi:hypothetical protein